VRLGIKTGVEQGHLVGPRLFIAGQSIGPTGGHSDGRRRPDVDSGCACCNGLAFKSSVADGIDEVRKAAREQMRQGADHVKIMMSGGVGLALRPRSDSLQFSEGEVRAAVEEATAFGRYVCAHAYSAEAITRAARLGVRTIEHGKPDRRRSRQAEWPRRACSWSPTSSPTYAMKERGGEVRHDRGEPGEERHRVGRRLAITRDLQAPRRAGPLRQRPAGRAALGSEREFTLRRDVVAPIEIIRSATTISCPDPAPRRQGRHARSRRLRRSPGGRRQPLQDLALLEDQGKHLSVIMKAGISTKRRLH